mmetsp:Transcript_23921/g.34308  ORF Transcript_23921/g.34308 Transcript_23921/m.34308 type:complete len:137 (-) Transcript_23921:209-619(-)|eukprot:CAMPEP_0172437722 /NCGR_PEP_ID=MMETSP1064-20121228/72412_1 /TAXON_ID=202472 /ORGANISM="Aulacoseira subarctica , Strain CCAP 1002/5" /LENGTH=136 /DNA_ID=CAMNT_0013186221 /DNA_START=97 /DNA_END=507 /DNA_ORIENTATION=+
MADDTKATNQNTATTATTNEDASISKELVDVEKNSALPPNASSTDLWTNVKSAFQKIKLPTGDAVAMESITPHLKDGLLYSAIGAAAGGLVGAVLFKSGRGMRASSAAAGAGVAVGSMVERVSFEWQQQEVKKEAK